MDVLTTRQELLHVADAVAREKGIERDQVLEAMEIAIQKAAKAKYGLENDIRAMIDRKSGDIHLARYREIVESVENTITQISLQDASRKNPQAQLGEFIIEVLPPIDFGRVSAQSAKQVIIQKVRDAERERQYNEFKDKIGEIVSGVVKRVDFGNVILDLGRTEAILMRDELIPRENFQPGDRVRAYIYDVRREPRGSQIFLSRTKGEFMAKLFAQEVPEIYQGVIEIKCVARDPGSRAKIGVYSHDSSLDPVGACVGMRGSRVQAVVNELQGEKVDIVPWSEDIVTFVVNALAPAEAIKVVMDAETGRLEVVVPDHHLSLAIGRRGQNVKLASQLTGCYIDVLTESEEAKRRQEEVKVRSELFIQALDIDDVIAHLLVTEDFSTVEEIALVPLDDLTSIEGFDETVAQELQNRAKTWLDTQHNKIIQSVKEQGLSDEVIALPHLSGKMLEKLVTNNIKTLDDVADLAADELIDVLKPEILSEEMANVVIMQAREHWFVDQKKSGKSK